MPTAKGKKLKPSQNKEKGIFRWGLVVWPFLIWAGLSAICFGLDKLDPAMETEWVGAARGGFRTYPIPGNPVEWAPVVWAIIAALIVYIVGCWIIYQHAKRYRGNAVRWATASVVFSPVLAGIAYGLTWPKSQ